MLKSIKNAFWQGRCASLINIYAKMTFFVNLMRVKSGFLLPVILAISLFLHSCDQSNRSKVSIKDEDNLSYKNPTWADSLISAFRSFKVKKDINTAEKLYKAAELMPVKNWEIYLLSATLYAPSNEPDKAFMAINQALEAGLRDDELLESLTELRALKNDKRWNMLIDTVVNRKQAYLKRIRNPELLITLKNMWERDQTALSNYEENIKSLGTAASQTDHQRYFRPVEAIWENNKIKLDSIITIYGWPGYSLVGEEGAEISWAIAQHYPDVSFKRNCLVMIKEAVKAGDADPNHYAELNDRIARDTWTKQTYGASMADDAPHPISNPSYVNQRRFVLGLSEPIEVYAFYHGIDYQMPGLEKAKTDSLTSKNEAQKIYSEFQTYLGKKQIDSAIVSIKKAIKFHGDITNKQLYQAAIDLSQIKNESAEQLSLTILKVLIWREWEGRSRILDEERLKSVLNQEKWLEIKELLEKTMHNNMKP